MAVGIWQKSITWASVDTDHSYIIVSHGNNEFIKLLSLDDMPSFYVILQ